MRKIALLFWVSLLLVCGCSVTPKDHWPLGSQWGSGGSTLGSPTADMAFAVETSRFWRDQNRKIDRAQWEIGVAKANRDYFQGNTPSCDGSLTMRVAYWSTLNNLTRRDINTLEQAEWSRGRQGALDRIKKRMQR